MRRMIPVIQAIVSLTKSTLAIIMGLDVLSFSANSREDRDAYVTSNKEANLDELSWLRSTTPTN